MACPNCWHTTCISLGGIGNYSINDIITHTGGNLDSCGRCATCSFNIAQVQLCTSCTFQSPCSRHYASGYNGSFSKNMPAEMHKLYMRNSPYQQSWSQRPASVGRWYGSHPRNYCEAIALAKRFTPLYEPLSAFLHLEQQLKYSSNIYKDFWTGYRRICRYYFASSDPVSIAMASYYSTLQSRNLPH